MVSTDSFSEVLSWWYSVGYAPLTERTKASLQSATSSSPEAMRAENDLRILGFFTSHEGAQTLDSPTLRRIWDENLARLRRAVPQNALDRLISEPRTSKRSQRKMVKLLRDADLQLYPIDQIRRLMDEHDGGLAGGKLPLPEAVKEEAPPANEASGQAGGENERATVGAGSTREEPIDIPPLSGTYYETLGVDRGAATDEIKARYRLLALQFHPDRQSSPERRDQFSAVMARISEAYGVLGDPRLREIYDETLAQHRHESDRTRFIPRPDACIVCGSAPSAEVVLRGGVGLFFHRRVWTLQSRLCRDCGIEMFRTAQNRTLLQGWWGFVAFFANFVYIAQNTSAFLVLRRLDKPITQEVAPGQPSSPLGRGRPLVLRSGIWVSAIVLVGVGLWITGHFGTNSDGPPSSSDIVAGACVTTSGRMVDQLVDCSQPHGAMIVGTGSSQSDCPTETTNYFVEKSSDPNPGRVVCLDTKK